MSTEMNINNIFTPSPPDNNILSIINLSELDNIILESIIPEQTKRQFIPGKFLYIDSEQERIMLQNAWAAITQLELWVYMQLNTVSYMFNDHRLINLISKKMVDLGYDGHTGTSFGWTLRQMQYIAINGEEVYMMNIKDKTSAL
jgi:hypothetical protein